MVKNLYFIILFSGFFSLLNASDRLEDLQKEYDRYVLGIIPEGDPQPVKRIRDEISSANLEKARSKLETLGIFRRDIISLHEHQEKQEVEHHAPLFHALTASISLFSCHLKQVQQDADYKWTYQHGLLFDGPNKLPLEGVTVVKSEEDDSNILTLKAIANNQLYEIERQRINLELTYFWELFIVWKSNIFPGNTVSSYCASNAHALSNQVKDILVRRTNTIVGIPLPKDESHYLRDILETLTKVDQALPKQLNHIVYLNNTSHFPDLEGKINKSKSIIKEKEEKFKEAYFNFTNIVVGLQRDLQSLQQDPFSLLHSSKASSFRKKVLDDYKKFRHYLFPGEGHAIKFGLSPLNLNRIFAEISQMQVSRNIDSSSPSPFEGQSLQLTNQLTAQGSQTISSTQVSVIPRTASMIAESSENPTEEPLEITYDATYWKEQHRIHTERKKLLPIVSNALVVSSAVTTYEADLFNYLKENVYKYTPKKKRNLIAELKKLKFEVIPNARGNGSTHEITPMKDNPLFGNNPEYTGAYFNLHLPSNDDIIKPGYFTYLQSGFDNVFGLSLDYINEKMALFTKE